MVSKRSRAFCFTLNNPKPDSEQLLERISGVEYLTFGREKGESGTPHLQGYIYFTNAKTHSAVRKLLPGCHVEPAKTVSAAIEYCQKDGDFIEFGIRPVDPAAKGLLEKKRWDEIWKSAIDGDLPAIPADVRLRFYGTICRVRKDHMVKPGDLEAPCGTWIYGKSGVGKSFSVRNLFPNLYSKNSSKWWDGYQEEDTVLFDDLGTDQVGWISRFLKIWPDQYSFIADIKGGSICIRPRRFIVTSQFTIRELFTDPTTVDALERRFKFIEKLNKEQEIFIE
jgi:hypothetical protein